MSIDIEQWNHLRLHWVPINLAVTIQFYSLRQGGGGLTGDPSLLEAKSSSELLFGLVLSAKNCLK